MKKKKQRIALIYDFDGTLAPGNMQEYDFFPEIGIKPIDFWQEVKGLAKQHNADEILMYMYLMLKKAKEKNISVHKTKFRSYGKTIKFFDGVDTWFDRINLFGNTNGVEVEHYIISSGLVEMIEGTTVNKYIKKVFASSFLYTPDKTAEGPALAVNYTTKTQFVFRINKGIFNVYDNSKINKYVRAEDRYLPFANIIYLGDGETDVPCMSLIKSMGGTSIAVYKKNTKGAKLKADKLMKEGRANFVAQADYSDNEKIDEIVKSVIQHLYSKYKLMLLQKK